MKATQCREANTTCKEEKSVHTILKHSDFPTRDVLIQKWKLFDTPVSLIRLLGSNDLNPCETDFIFIFKKNHCAFFTVLQQTGCTPHWEPTEINVTGTGHGGPDPNKGNFKFPDNFKFSQGSPALRRSHNSTPFFMLQLLANDQTNLVSDQSKWINTYGKYT